MQQPPNPYLQYPQQQWHQQPPYPPQQYQQPPQYPQPMTPPQWQQPQMPPQQQWQQQPQYGPPLPPPAPKKPGKGKFFAIGCGGLVALVVLVVVIAAIASAGGNSSTAPTTQTSQQTHATQQPTLQPTSARTMRPTPKPTVQSSTDLAATHGTPHLGGPVSDFIGAYGQPDPHSTIQPGLYNLHFLPSTSPNSNVDGLIVDTDPSNTALAANITVQAQNGNAQTSAVGWTVNDAKARCMTFAPSDAHFVKEFVYADNTGFDMVYTSVQLAKDFPASAFIDNQQNQIQAGTFDVSYLDANDGQHISSCDMIIGEQQTTN